MAEISKITLPSGTTYDIKDEVARLQIAAITGGDAVSFAGVSETLLTDGGTQKPTIDEEQVEPKLGQLYFYGVQEFIWGPDDKWHALGESFSNLGQLATKNSASTNYTPKGNVTGETFEGTEGDISVTGTPTGTVSTPTFTGTAGTVSVSGTPNGAINVTTTGTANYTPAGNINIGNPVIELNTVSRYVVNSESNQGSVTAGKAAACTLPVLETSVANETLTLSWTAGSFTTNTPTTVTHPSFNAQNIATSVASATSGEATFSGTPVSIGFNGSSTTMSGSFTPQGNVSQPTFSGDSLTATGKFTPEGTVSGATFTGTQETITVS